MRRTKHGLSHYTLQTFDMGQLIPVSNFEVLPGDSIRMSTSALLRVSPLMAPVMHPVNVRIHHWFVPYRLLWDDWEDFITGGPDGTGAGTPYPSLTGTPPPNTLLDYLGVPPGISADFSLFPLRAYNKIFNEFYRDQDLIAEVGEDNNVVQNVAWEKDQYTAARPWTQKGPDVTVPLAGEAPVKGIGVIPTATWQSSVSVDQSDDGGSFGTVYARGAPAVNAGANQMFIEGDPNTTSDDFPYVRAEIGVDASINEFRRAFALQRYQEARAQYGSRYTEYLRYLGVRSSDARLQRPEYLGGGRSTITFSEVLKTGEGDTPSDESPIGELRGHGISAMRSRRFIRFFEEHGVVMTLASVRPRTMYANGLHRQWSRRTKEDYWQKELELIGQQEVYKREVNTSDSDPNGILGYNERYADYRHLPSYVAGEFRSLLADWHLARIFASDVALNSDFVTCVPSKRIHAEQTQHSLWGMFSHSVQARRMVGNRTIGRVL